MVKARKKRESLRGLMVDHSPDGPVVRTPGSTKPPTDRAPPGYYVYVRDRVGGSKVEWVAVLVATFLRKLDAERAAACLTAAGLDSAKALSKVTFQEARTIACRDLQW